MDLVIVESPAKAKTINKYLGKDVKVLASFGHIRDLPSKDGSVRPEEDFAMDYEIDSDAKKRVSEIAAAAKQASNLYLATDPDREGEAISWHVLEALREKKALKKNTNVKRIVFNAITKNAVTEGFSHPRDIDMNLVNAQQARRALDYLVGFNLSPLLWRKLPGCKSAGRVQSVALRLVCEREEEIESFISQEYWDVQVKLENEAKSGLTARLTHLSGQKLDKFAISDEKQAKEIAGNLENKRFQVSKVEPKQVKRNPYAPFTTSTLQQEASRKLGFGAQKTMMTAQKLYEGLDIGGETVGLITYMRTDGVDVAPEAIQATRSLVEGRFGKQYLPEKPRLYKSKLKNAQEAHEAIRPTDLFRTPEKVKQYLDKDQFRLYELIWKRMVASQMASAVLDQVGIDFDSEDNYARLRATGSVIKFDGFFKLYREDRDDGPDEDEEKTLPPLKEGETLEAKEVKPEQHFTQPPPRYTEASLVKKLEELGIGRPSTYASIISVLRNRDYVRLEKRRFHAEDRGRLVNAFLLAFFPRYVEYDFTARMETRLDEISEGRVNWKELLRNFWSKFSDNVGAVKDLKTSEVIRELNKLLGPLIFPKGPDGQPDRSCPACEDGRLSLKTGKFGAFIGCSNYPDCRYTRPLTAIDGNGEESGQAAAEAEYPKVLGQDPETQEEVSIRKGPYGIYVQRGEGKEAKRTTVPKTYDPSQVDLQQALGLLSLPREVGKHPETGKKITASIGRFGPYVKHETTYASLSGDDDVLSVGMNRAVSLLAEAKKKGPQVLKNLGKHPETGEEVTVRSGRYGPYIKHQKTNAPVPKGTEPTELTMEQAVDALKAKEAKGGGKKGTAKKTTAKKKPAAKKKTSKSRSSKKASG